MPIAHLEDRAVIRVAGADAYRLLNDVVTVNMNTVAAQGIGFGALLSPQGKILFDFFIHRNSQETKRGADRETATGPKQAGCLIDVRAECVADLVKRLDFYKLRADVAFTGPADEFAVGAFWGDGNPNPAWPADPRLVDLGLRGIVGRGGIDANATATDWHANRIAAGVPEGGLDFAFGQTFPHDAAMDQLNGIDFGKGCYVGQEVVSRMKHRGTARRRIAVVDAEDPLPAPGTEILAGGRTVGQIGTSVRVGGIYRAVAIVRIDRLEPDSRGTCPASAGDVDIRITMPPWARYRPAKP